MTPPSALNKVAIEPASRPYKQVEVGRVISVGSSMAMISVNKSIIRNNSLNLVQLGTVLKILTSNSIVVAMVSSLKIGAQDDEGMSDGCLARLDIMGEISTNSTTRETKFFRGVRSFPVLSEPVYNMSSDDLSLIFATKGESSINVGRLQQDNSIVARVKTDDLLSKHFAIIGSTGSGKSCTVALVLHAILRDNQNGHVVLFDPHNEYSQSFGNMGHVIRNDTLDIPLWMFNFEETVELLTSEIADHAREEEEVLSEVILRAKQLFDRALQGSKLSTQVKIDDGESELQRAGPHISLDSPVPYRVRDVLRLIDHEMGKLENNSNLGPYKRLKRRIEAFLADQRYQFIFRNQASPDSISSICGKIFRIPVAGKPISILDMSGIPSEALNIVVSVVSRLAFELSMWSERRIPILLVCEEAHRYIPADPSLGFKSTRRAISRIAKEGRKYGVSLAIISQRPSELEPSTLSQCSTIFSMRLSNERDQNFVKAAVPDGAAQLLSFLPSLGVAETMIFGESVNLPMRVILDNLAEDYRPHSSSAKFSVMWNRPDQPPAVMDRVFENWRTRSHKHGLDTARNVGAATHQRRVVSGTQHMAPAHGMPNMHRPETGAHDPAGSHMAGASIPPQTQHMPVEEPPQKPQSLMDVKKILNSAFHRGT